MALRHTFTYLKNFFRDKKVASVTPCSRFTIQRLCDKIDYGYDQVIVEFGPGSGGFTRYMLDAMSKDSILITIEINEAFARQLKNVEKEDSRLIVYQAGAENLSSIMEQENLHHIHHVVSGIPFSMINNSDKESIIKQTNHFLVDEGKFLLYQTTYNMVPHLKKYFREVHKDFEPRNLPPMYLMEALK